MAALDYKNKLFSVLGDSISTLEGYSVPKGAEFYEGMNKFMADVFSPKNTWWGQVISRLGGELLINNSFSGSIVCEIPKCEIPSYGCSDERTSALHRGGALPDVIMIFMGINDWGCGIAPTEKYRANARNGLVFERDYARMLEKLKKNYPSAELWCFTLPVSACRKSGSFEFPYYCGGYHIAEYCEAIRACAEKYECRVIDLYKAAEMHDTIDGFHPNARGMKTLAENVVNALDF